MICKCCRIAGDIARTDLASETTRTYARALHGRCKGETWCDCQHKERKP